MHPARNNVSHPGSTRGGALMIARASAIVLFARFASTGVLAQAADRTPQAAASPEAIKQREQELEAARAEQRNAVELQQKLKAEVAAIGEDRSKLNAQLIDIAAQ